MEKSEPQERALLANQVQEKKGKKTLQVTYESHTEAPVLPGTKISNTSTYIQIYRLLFGVLFVYLLQLLSINFPVLPFMLLHIAKQDHTLSRLGFWLCGRFFVFIVPVSLDSSITKQNEVHLLDSRCKHKRQGYVHTLKSRKNDKRVFKIL